MFKIYSARLVYRIAVLVAAILLYLRDKSSLIISKGLSINNGPKFVHLLWLILAAGTVRKFFPQSKLSMGCRKQFKSNYAPSEKKPLKSEITACVKAENAAAQKVFILWLSGNIVVASLYYANVLGESELVLLSLCYYVCDLICVLFYCPFQSMIMKNRCCVTCRIFNWDSIMMFTPLIFISGFFSWSLVIMALLVLVRWEVTYRKYPQLFLEESNKNLKCRYCHENLCMIKKHI